jgi:hypothetical protein
MGSMIRFEAKSNGWPEIKISLEGVPVFLDQFAIKKLAKEDSARRGRFTKAMRSGGDLVFSVSNAAELTGPTGESAERIKEFLSGLGAHWFPVEMDAKVVSDREADMLFSGKVGGMNLADAIACKKLVKNFFEDRITNVPKGELIDLSPDHFFDLGWFMGKLSPQRDSIIAGKRKLDDVLSERIAEHRRKHDRDPNWIEKAFPDVPFDSRFPTTFTYAHLMRTLIEEAKGHKIKRNDGIDFGQAVVAPSITKLATLDKHWKRRVGELPQPNGLARIYCESELDAFVDDFEKRVSVELPPH